MTSVRMGSLIPSNSLYSVKIVVTGILPSCVSMVIAAPRVSPDDFSNQSVVTSSPFFAFTFQQSKPPMVPSPVVSTLSKRLSGSTSFM